MNSELVKLVDQEIYFLFTLKQYDRAFVAV